jgi:hypothetical protein
MAKPQQETLPGVPGPAKRKIIEEIEDLCLEMDKIAGKRTALGDTLAEKNSTRQELLAKHKIPIYTYEDANGVLQDVFAETVLKKRKSKLNPKKPKKDGAE